MTGDRNFFGAIAEVIHNENESVGDLTNIIRFNIVGPHIEGIDLDPYMIQYFANTYHYNVNIRFVAPNNAYGYVIRVMDLSPEAAGNTPYNIDLDYTGEYYTPAFYAFDENNVYLTLNNLLDFILEEDRSSQFDYFIDVGLIDLYAVDNNGNNILHLAVMAYATEIITVIVVENDINIEAVNNEGNTAADYAFNDFIEELLVVKKKDYKFYWPEPELKNIFRDNSDQDPDKGGEQLSNNHTTDTNNKVIDAKEIYSIICFYDELIHHKVDFSGDFYNAAIDNDIAVYI